MKHIIKSDYEDIASHGVTYMYNVQLYRRQSNKSKIWDSN